MEGNLVMAGGWWLVVTGGEWRVASIRTPRCANHEQWIGVQSAGYHAPVTGSRSGVRGGVMPNLACAHRGSGSRACMPKLGCSGNVGIVQGRESWAPETTDTALKPL